MSKRDILDITPEGREAELITPTGDSTGIVFLLRSPDAKEIKAVKRRWEDTALRFRGRPPAKERKLYREHRLVAGVDGWRFEDGAMLVAGEEKPEFSERLLRDLLKVDWIAEFLDSEMGDETTFFPSSGES